MGKGFRSIEFENRYTKNTKKKKNFETDHSSRNINVGKRESKNWN